MSLKKQYLKNKPVCKVTFTLPKSMANSADKVSLVGEFNDWDPGANPMKRRKDGAFDTTVSIPTGREYQFRYLLDGISWENDDCADRYVRSPYGDSENSVVSV
jgi:1,4-alpha-glucan branching enzyme